MKELLIKQAPTPKNRVNPKTAIPTCVPVAIEPNPIMVVREVSNMARPVNFMTKGTEPLPSIL